MEFENGLLMRPSAVSIKEASDVLIIARASLCHETCDSATRPCHPRDLLLRLVLVCSRYIHLKRYPIKKKYKEMLSSEPGARLSRRFHGLAEVV